MYNAYSYVLLLYLLSLYLLCYMFGICLLMFVICVWGCVVVVAFVMLFVWHVFVKLFDYVLIGSIIVIVWHMLCVIVFCLFIV